MTLQGHGAVYSTHSFTFLVVGAIATGWSLWQLWRGWRTRSWTPVAAEVVELSYPVVGRGRFGRPVHRYDVRCRYVVDGVAFDADRLSVSGDTSALDALGGKGLGAQTTIYYDPDRPQRAVLRRGARLLNVAGLLAGAVLLYGGWFNPM